MIYNHHSLNWRMIIGTTANPRANEPERAHCLLDSAASVATCLRISILTWIYYHLTQHGQYRNHTLCRHNTNTADGKTNPQKSKSRKAGIIRSRQKISFANYIYRKAPHLHPNPYFRLHPIPHHSLHYLHMAILHKVSLHLPRKSHTLYSPHSSRSTPYHNSTHTAKNGSPHN